MVLSGTCRVVTTSASFPGASCAMVAGSKEACHWLGAYQTAIDFYNRALNINIALQGKQHQDVATIYSNLAFAHLDNGNTEQAATFMQTALQILETLHTDTNHPALKTIRQNLALIQDNMKTKL